LWDGKCELVPAFVLQNGNKAATPALLRAKSRKLGAPGDGKFDICEDDLETMFED
jgi:hypothetical protein